MKNILGKICTIFFSLGFLALIMTAIFIIYALSDPYFYSILGDKFNGSFDSNGAGLIIYFCLAEICCFIIFGILAIVLKYKYNESNILLEIKIADSLGFSIKKISFVLLLVILGLFFISIILITSWIYKTCGSLIFSGLTGFIVLITISFLTLNLLKND